MVYGWHNVKAVRMLTVSAYSFIYGYRMIKRIRQIIHPRRSFLITSCLCALLIIGVVVVWPQPSKTPELPSPSLKALAASRQMDVGNFAISSLLNEKPYTDILTSQFNLALADNTPNWYFTDGGLRPSQSSYNFKQMDQVVEFAEAHDMKVQAHHYVWGEEKWLPDWLKNGNYSRDEVLRLMTDHIQTVGARYSGRVAEWTVVNEAFSRSQHIYGLHDWWADNTGGSKDYIDKAFIAARAADPQSVLILNDFNNESINDISNEMHSYIKDAKARDVPIDGIGMQMHIDGTHPPTKDEVVSNMKRFGDLGVDVYVTEFDVNMNDVKGSDEDRNEIEAAIYYDMARACIESGVCKSFAILGITDKETWYNHLGLADARPLPFDRHYQPKPAFWALRRAFEQP